ncbi:MAG: hypothetical protein KA236_10105 [Verrucomicrobia bacterium]|nr:hypothetical protein [Verrucomicrobiota bacterium]
MENTLKGNPSATNTLSPDVYQGAVAYLMGMAYFEKVGRFDMLNRRLHKVQVASQLAFGLSSIRAARVNNALPSGNIDLVQPSIDMFYKEVAIAGNTTIRLDSGDDGMVPNDDYFHLFIADGSAQEHSIINHFFNQTDAVSTMKLLQVAQAKSATNGQPGILVLDYTNYVTEGNKNYPTGGTTKLKDQSPPIWASVTNAFASYTYPFANYVQVLITPGPVTNQTQSFKGMAVLILQPSGATAAIAEKNGSYGANNPAGSLALANTPNLWLGVDADNNYSMNLTAPSASSITLAPDAYASYGAGSVANYADLNYYAYSGFQSAWTSDSMDYLGLGSLGALNLNYSQSVEAANGNQGWLGQLTDALGQALSHVADPVHAVTGEFYISATDIVLPGPMPLAVSRNYSSLNLADNQFGYGWKFNFMPYLSLNADATLVYAAEADGAVLAYEQTATNANVYLPTPAKNPQLNNNSTAGIGSTANRLQNRITKQTVGSDTYYYLTQADGGKRSFKVMTFAGTVNRTRPYLTRWEDHRGNAFTFEYGTNSAASDFAEVRRVQSSNGNFLGLQYDVYGHITEAWTGDGRRLSYAYDQFGDLVNVTLPDQSVIGYDYEHKTQAVTNGSVVTQVPYSTHLVLKENKPDGRTLKNEYDPHRRVTNQWSTVGPDLNLVRNATFIYANNFNLTNSFTNTITGYTLVKDVFNQTTRYEYTNGLITRIVDPLNQTIEQQWYADSAAPPGYPRSLWKQKDKRGLWTEFKYDPRGNVTNTVIWGDLTGDGTTQYATNTMAYGTNNLPVETTDPVGNKVLTQYHPQFPFLPEFIIRQAGATLVSTNKRVYYSVTNTFVSGGVTYTNLALGLLQREIRAFNSPDAATNDFSHDGRGFVTRTIRYTGTSDPAVTNIFFYNDRGELVEQTDADGRMVRLDRDPMGRPTAREVYEAGQVVPLAWDYTYYNENGEVTWTDGPRYNPEDYVWRDYDGAGRQTTEIRWRSRARADGTGVEAAPDAELYAQTFQQFDAFGNLIRVVNPRGVITTNTWDAIGQLVSRKVLEPNGTVLTAEGFAYEPGGLVTRHTNALGGLTETLYTSTGQPRYRKDADSATNAWRYYRDGRIYLEIQRNGAYWETTYDDALRKTTRVFRNSGGTALATNLSLFDRRGNAIVTTDAAGYSFTNTFDGLDRLKSTVGPTTMTIVPSGTDPLSLNFVTNYAQQLTMRIYDASGKVLTVTNALGDKTISTSDALGRTVKVEVRNASNRLVRVTTTGYSADHHGVTVTNGSGSSAIVSASFTDNSGSPVLSVAYPSANNREFTLREYDWVGNLTFEGRYSASGSVVSDHSGVWQWYDSLNRVSLRMELDGALTGFSYDGLGNVTNRSMPNDLQWQATYNSAGQMLTENDRNGAQTTRSTVYSYYPAGNAWAGLLKTVTDGRNVTRTNSYDQFLRVATVTTTGPQAEQQMTLAWNYDVRGLLTNATLAFASTTGGPATRIERRYNAYTLLTSDFGFADNVELTYLGQGWDVAGRRTAIGGMGFQYRADGLMSGMNGGTFGYGDNGLLTGRTNAFRSLTVNQRDGVGRLLQTTTRVGTSTALTESWVWTGDGLPTTYTATRSDFTDTRRFGYGAYHRRLTNESLTLASGQTATNFYTFDNGTAGGLGVLTKAGPTAASAAWTSGADAFSRISAETNTVLHRTALGTVNGPARLSGNVNGRPVDFRYNRSAAGQWSAALELLPGTNTLTVYAEHPSTQFTTNQVSTFTVAGGAQDRVDSQFDPGGYVTNRVWKNSQGQTQRSQALVWDAFGRLVKVRERDANTNGFNWQADFDPLGRRLRTTTVPVTNGVALSAQPRTLVHSYDPAVEFLEIGVAVNGVTTWKNYGPDLDGRYGGQMGLGGLESLATGSTIVGIVQDGFGNVLGRSSGTVTWNAARSSLYGPVEGYPALSLSVGPLTSEHLAWRGKWRDETGLFYWGARPYDPARRNFLSVDPLGHGSDPGLYAAFNGNPAVYWDADGRYGKGWAEGWGENSLAPANSSLAYDIGMTLGGIQGEYFRGLGGGGSITANTLTFGGSDYIGLTDSWQYQGSAYTGSRILSTIGRESAIAAATLGTFQMARLGSEGAYYGYQGLQVVNAGRSGWAIGTGIDQVSRGNNWGYLSIAGGGLGLAGGFTMTSIAPELNNLNIAQNQLFSSTVRELPGLGFSAPENGSVFYSGPGNRQLALGFADSTGAVPIDRTLGGIRLNQLDLYHAVSPAQADFIWSSASQA